MVKLLIVEDDPSIRDVLVRRLAREGFQSIVATNGMQAIALASADRPNLILLDLSLPILDGWQTAKRLRASPETWTIPIIVLSGHILPHEPAQIPDDICDDTESKPINFSRLIAKIRLLANLDQGNPLNERAV